MKHSRLLVALLSLIIGGGNLFAQTNIIAGWDGGSDTSSPSNFGWTSSANRTLQPRNNNGGIRMTTTYSGYKLEDGSAYSYSESSNPSSIVFWLRYNTAGESFTYTFKGLEPNHNYDFSALVGWHNNSSNPTFTVVLNDGTNNLATMSKSVTAKQTLYEVSSSFRTPSTVTNTTDIKIVFTCNQTGDCMEAISALKLVEVVKKDELFAALTYANRVNSTINSTTLASQITFAQNVYDKESASQTEVNNAKNSLNSTVVAALVEANREDMTFVIDNPGFESCTETTTNAAAGGSAAPLAIGGNWSQASSAAWSSSAVVSYGGTGQVNGASAPSADNAGNSGKALGISVGWSGSVAYQSSAILLPAGDYTLKVNGYNAHTATQFKSIFGFKPTTGNLTSSSKEAFTSNTWDTDEVTFTLTETTEGIIQVGGTAISGGSGDNAKVFFDNITLTYTNPLAAAISAWQTAHDNLAELDATLLPDAAEAAITQELEKSCPDTESEISDATAALQALIDSYEEIKNAYSSYKDLKASVEDLKNTAKYTFTGDEALSTFNSTLSEISESVEAATDAETINNLLQDLKAAGNTFVASIESTDGFDVTYNIVNNSFETGELSPWTTSGKNDTGVKYKNNSTYATSGVDGDYLFNTWDNGTGSKVSQTILNLPEGYYTVTALVASDADNIITIMAGSSNKEVTTSDKGTFVEGITDKTLVSDGSLEIGANSSKWYKADNFRLTYYTARSVASEAWNAAKAAAEAAIDDEAYDNVTGEERTALQAEIDKAEPTTAEAYGEATTALQNATACFKNAKEAYDGFVEASSIEMPDLAYVSEEKRQQLDEARSAEPNTAEAARTATENIITALRAFYESHAMAESVTEAVNMTNDIADWNPDSNKGWTNGIGVDNRDEEKYTDANGNPSGKYYDGGWSQNAGVNINMTREVNVPAGRYLLTVTARGSLSLTEYKMSVGETTVDLPKNGSEISKGVFGHGWDDVSLEFESEGTPFTLSIIATSTESQQWISFNRFRLVQLEANNDVYAGETEYAALNGAIETAEAKTLGFDAGEYAPYNNVTALQALAAAKAIDQTAVQTNLKTDVEAATTALSSATWTANTEEVNAIFDGGFETDYSDQTGNVQPIGWYRIKGTEDDGYNVRYMGGTNAGLAATSTGKALFTKFAGFYGWADGYTMPLNANTTYELTFVYCGWGDCKKDGYVTITDAEGNNIKLSNNRLPLDATDGDANKDSWKSYKAYFTTGEAGNYVLGLRKDNENVQSQYAYGDFKLVKAVAENVTINEEENYTPAEKYANVTFKRTLVEGWNGLVLPFDMTVNDAKTKFKASAVKDFTGVDYDAEKGATLKFSDATEIKAGKPFMIKAAAGTEYIINNVILKTDELRLIEQSAEDAKYIMTGTYEKQSDLKDFVLIQGGKYYEFKGEQTASAKPFRAYFKNQSTGVAASKGISFDFGEETDGITLVENTPSNVNNYIYNLQGQKVNRTQRGVYIVNGKKVVIK